jgi:hypothetical protein
MLRKVGACGLSVSLSLSLNATAATLTSTASKEGKTIISLKGELSEGDSDALKSIIKSANDVGRFVSGLRLNSPGGLVSEGVKLADVVRYAKISTVVANGATCASACFIVFAAGLEKFASYNANIGVHGASDKSGEETVASGAVTVSMARIVKDLGVPSAIIGKMVVTPPDQMVWLTPDDLRSMSTTMTGKPSQLSSAPNSQLEAPMQLDPSATATAPSQPKSWQDIVDRAAALSARQQQNGQPFTHRVCQPEFKECMNAIFFRDTDGKDMMVKESEDAAGKTVRREICSFNAFGDVRVCFNWDTHASHRDMKDEKGNWTEVGNSE